MNWLHGAEEEFLVGAATANLLLLARPDPTHDRPGPAVALLSERINHMARISRCRFDQSYYATIF